MVSKPIRVIWFICLCASSLTLAWCFHVPDQDWLPSKNKVDTWNTQKNDDVEQALSSFMDGIDMVSSQRNAMKYNKTDETEYNQNEPIIEVEDGTINDEILDQEVSE